MELAHYLSQYAADHEYGLRPGSIAQIRYAVESFTRHLGHAATLTDLEDAKVSGWIDWLRANRSLHTARSQRGAVLTLWRAAWYAGLVDQPPKRIRKLRMPPPAPDAWNAVQIARLVAMAQHTPGRFNRSQIRVGAHLVAFLRLAWDSGLRLGDLLRVRADQIAPGGRLDVVQHKTGVRQLVRLWPETVAAIRCTLSDQPRELVLPFAARVYQYHIARAAAACGLGGSIKWIRRGVATAAEHAGGYGSQMLGHADGRALRFYLDRSQAEPVMAPRLAHPAPDPASLNRGPLVE